MDFIDLEKDLKVLSDKTRLKLLQLIYQGQSCGCDLINQMEITQPTLSHHLNILSDHGYIKGVKDKNKILYTVDLAKIKNSLNLALDLITYKTDCDI